MSDIIIRTENLGKVYRIGERWGGYKTLRDTIGNTSSALLRYLRRIPQTSNPNNQPDRIWALKGISLGIKRGEVVGIIGHNGAGKTTLLKILSRITEPTEGWAEIHGRVGSLLEVGTGFHPELTGRENIYLNGAILGMKKTEIKRKFDEIVAFAEIEKFIDTPVKRYSSGMYVRLAFAVAAHLDPEILLVDEVLAVGDVAFQKKCLGKMGNVAKEGRTVLFVSHNMGAITRLCPRAIRLGEGHIVADGSTRKIVEHYQMEQFQPIAAWQRPHALKPSPEFEFTAVRVKKQSGQVCGVFSGDEPITIEIEYIVKRYLNGSSINAWLYNAQGTAIFCTADNDASSVSALPRDPGKYLTRFSIPGNLLAPGRCSLRLGAHLPGRTIYDQVEYPVTFEVCLDGSYASLDDRRFGVVISPLMIWETCKIGI